MSPILQILTILAILIQTKEPLRSLRTFSPYCRGGAIDIKVFQTFSACETNERAPCPVAAAAGASEHPHPENPAHLEYPASDKRAIKVLKDLFSLLPRRCYRH